MREKKTVEVNGDSSGVIIFRRNFLPISETFILDHIHTLHRWRPLPVCERRAKNGIQLKESSEPQYLLSDTKGIRRLKRIQLCNFGISSLLDALVEKKGAKILHAHFLFDALPFIRYVRRKKLPLVVTAHGYDATLNDETLKRRPEGAMLIECQDQLADVATMILCVSEFIRDSLLRKGFPERKLHVQPLGIDLSKFGAKRVAGDRYGVLYAGRLVEKKGVDYLIRAWRLMPQKKREQGLTIIGGGPLAERLKSMANDDPTITFLGPQPHDVIRKAMREHRVFAFPSIVASSGDTEGMGVVAMEAQASGMPIVAFDEGPVQEVMLARQSGVCIPGRDVNQYAGALADFLSDNQLATAFGRTGSEFVTKKFDLYENTKKLEALYDSVS